MEPAYILKMKTYQDMQAKKNHNIINQVVYL